MPTSQEFETRHKYVTFINIYRCYSLGQTPHQWGKVRANKVLKECRIWWLVTVTRPWCPWEHPKHGGCCEYRQWKSDDQKEFLWHTASLAICSGFGDRDVHFLNVISVWILPCFRYFLQMYLKRQTEMSHRLHVISWNVTRFQTHCFADTWNWAHMPPFSLDHL